MVEGQSLDKLLYTGANLALVAPGVYGGEVGDEGVEEGEDLVEARSRFFGDGRGERGLYGAGSFYVSIVVSVWGYLVVGRRSGDVPL